MSADLLSALKLCVEALGQDHPGSDSYWAAEKAGQDAIDLAPEWNEKVCVAGWNACRKSVYAVCEDVIREADAIPTDELEHARGYSAGMARAAKSIARAFNSMDAEHDDNLTNALTKLSDEGL